MQLPRNHAQPLALRRIEDLVCEKPFAGVRGAGRTALERAAGRDLRRGSLRLDRGRKIAQHDRNDFSERPDLASGRYGPKRVGAANPRFTRRAQLVLPPDRTRAIAVRSEFASTIAAIAGKSRLAREGITSHASRIAGPRAGERDSGSTSRFFTGAVASRGAGGRRTGRI